MRFAFIHAEKAYFPVAALCRVLEVTRQGYYAYAEREPGPRAASEAELEVRLRAVFEESRGTYGSPRVRAQLQRDGVPASKRRVERLMRGLGLVARRPRRFVSTTLADGTHRIEPNLLRRDFSASRPNERWVTDITYVQTDEGWAYLAVILDLCSRAVVGWSLDATAPTALALRALDMAVKRRRPPAGLLHHSDRGCQYTSSEYRAGLAAHGMEVSMSRKGNCWDNAVAESFFATLKAELVHSRRWTTRNELRSAVFEYVESFYNRRRLHSSLGYRTPAEIEQQLAAA
jgi:putative transposase